MTDPSFPIDIVGLWAIGVSLLMVGALAYWLIQDILRTPAETLKILGSWVVMVTVLCGFIYLGVTYL